MVAMTAKKKGGEVAMTKIKMPLYYIVLIKIIMFLNFANEITTRLIA